MSIRDWPASERPREKLLDQGAAALSDAELLAIFLRTGVAGKSAVDLARYLLAEFGSLRALLEADLDQFSAHLGLGPAKFAQLQAVLEMGRAGTWPNGCAAIRHWNRRRRYAITSRRACATNRTSCSAACFSTPSTGSWPSKCCSTAPSMAPASTLGRWSSVPWRRTRRR